MSSAPEDDVYAVQAKVTLQQSKIREMKKGGEANAQEILDQVTILNDLRANLQVFTDINKEKEVPFNRKGFDELILRKMYVVPSFEIHNGPAGLFDYGPPACTLKANVLTAWRRHFVLEEGMLEMECTCLTPSAVLETSGHVERFTDFMVKDTVTQECFRADKLLEEAIDALLLANPNMDIREQEEHKIIQRQADAFTAAELHGQLQTYKVTSPTHPENGLTEPFPFNLMFKTTIGPEGTAVGFLRPETAQGLFVNFRRLLDYNQQRMPFAAAQIGLGFRNEIAPRAGLLRVREFCMAEIEHFVHPQQKGHPKFCLLQDKKVVLFSSEAQLSTGRTACISIGEAVSSGMVNNETLGYFMARTQLWLEAVGVDPSRMRLRQHLKTEMAHYAADCWDMEINLSYGWIECVGHADRACYDLQQHARKTGTAMVASERLPEPIQVERLVAEPNKKLIGPRFKGEQKAVLAAIEALEGDELEAFKSAVEGTGTAGLTLPSGEVQVTSELVSFKLEKRTVVETKFTPSVIEPSFGIGRIMYAVLEHSFSQRDGDEQRCVMAFRPSVAPIKVGIYRLTSHEPFDALVTQIKDTLMRRDIACRVDSSSGTVGRRYSRADELGVPFGVTIDFQTLLDNSVTVRDRDSMAQVRVPMAKLLQLVQALVAETLSWQTVMTRFVVVNGGEEDEEGAKGDKAAAVANVTTVDRCTRASFSRPTVALAQQA
ncbi:glycyl tRNA synthetase [Ochromonadaceae sp. CCMP2298]|nr:glycyl tRNA synthetase [Ochromonadaceae sp. CCMP2298]|eukprot:CAMPEP_0173203184 /NCGR_PEP_ID=MMETSP1141-20130122/19381_1 /TAXON_ID=483371 /ORGANISM="non described non described, Strain CCMP2298" /LENGTH=715 /DNA_ID=CAMNT_0014128619 /DNA_START=151 /DNA_END=2298 /DNA_ORIENTATION=+